MYRAVIVCVCMCVCACMCVLVGLLNVWEGATLWASHMRCDGWSYSGERQPTEAGIWGHQSMVIININAALSSTKWMEVDKPITDSHPSLFHGIYGGFLRGSENRFYCMMQWRFYCMMQECFFYCMMHFFCLLYDAVGFLLYNAVGFFTVWRIAFFTVWCSGVFTVWCRVVFTVWCGGVGGLCVCACMFWF